MESQVTICCNRREGKECFCKLLVLMILLTLFAITLGIIIGAALSTVFLRAIAALIVLAIVLGVLSILEAIRIICCMEKNRRNCCKD